ncbi:MAG: peroxiredoxin [Gammaproteobacteria bacterium]|nr:peroxiredoxin [Gammaproteobacteria bacterium]MBU1732079.1 peroxiredoxin [Gammaproteobacteria bacterium]MBU1893135.1 peroxiredoxin [Gammaproteobacteria bacterium]
MKLALLALLLLVGALLWARLSQANDVPQSGQPAPGFELPDQNGKMHSLESYRGRWVVLYFYPKDDTPGCTQEACLFRDDLHKLTALGAQVIGVSVDDTASHAEFAKKYRLPFPLLSDNGGKVATQYGALQNLGLFKFAKRYTFLIDPQGKLAKTYQKVDTSRHSQEIIDDLAGLKGK